MFCFHLTDLKKGFIEASSFPDSMKKADVAPILKMDDNMNNANYRPLSLLPAFHLQIAQNFYQWSRVFIVFFTLLALKLVSYCIF